MSYPMEVFLRPPTEVWSGYTALGAATLAYMAPSTLMMTPSVGYTSAILFTLLGVYRLNQARRVIKYQRNLKKLPRYALNSKQIPTYRNQLFLGKGFKWGQQHTQRITDTLTPAAQKYLTPGKCYMVMRDIELNLEGTAFNWLRRISSSDTWSNPIRPLPPIGGNPALHGIELAEKEILLPNKERFGHTLVLGTTRVGKTRLAEILIEQDIMRGDGPVIVFDPKSDAGLLTRMYMAAKRDGREDDFYCFHLGFPEISARYNAIGNFSRITEVAGRVTGPMTSEGSGAAFKEFAWRFVNIVARALVSLGIRPDYTNILRYVIDIEPLFLEYCNWWLPKNSPIGWQEEVNSLEIKITNKNKGNRFNKDQNPRAEALRQYISTLKIYDPVGEGLISALRYDKTYFDKLVASLLPLLEKLTTGKVGELVAPNYFDVNDDRPIFDWKQIIRKKGIVYVGLDALTNTEVSAAVGNSMFSDLVSVNGDLYKHGYEHGMLNGRANVLPKTYLHADEFNELMGDEFLPMVNKSGGAGMQITAYTQSRSDIEAKLGNAAKAKQVEDNFNNLIMMRVKEKSTAELLTAQLPEVEVTQKMMVSGASDSSDTTNHIDFTSSTQDRISNIKTPMLDPSHITSLPKGQAFCLLDGGHLYKLRIPLPVETGDDMPENLQALTKVMQRDYHTSENWWTETVSS